MCITYLVTGEKCIKYVHEVPMHLDIKTHLLEGLTLTYCFVRHISNIRLLCVNLFSLFRVYHTCFYKRKRTSVQIPPSNSLLQYCTCFKYKR